MKTDAERLREKWKIYLAELQEWVARAGTLPSRRSSEPAEYRLANWLNRQRTDARKNMMEPERERLLRTVPGALEPRERKLSDLDLAERVRSFHTANGRLPRNRTQGESTAAWYLSRLRAKASEGSISAEALKVFSAIPRESTGQPPRPTYTVNDRLQQLHGYLVDHGHLPPWDDNGLRRWLWRAKHGQASANAEEADRARTSALELTEGYPRRAKSQSGRKPRMVESKYLVELEDYVATHGHLPPAGRDENIDLKFRRERLRELLKHQHITEERKSRIQALLSSPSWKQGNTTGAERIAAFYAENGRLPLQGGPAPESKLAHALKRLRARARSGLMAPPAIEALGSIPGVLPGREARE